MSIFDWFVSVYESSNTFLLEKFLVVFIMFRFNYFFLFLVFQFVFCKAQEHSKNDFNYTFVSFQYDLGRTSHANTYFPDTRPFQGLEFAIGLTNFSNELKWAKQLYFPRNGIAISYNNFGNTAKIGSSISVIPFLDFTLLNTGTKKLDLNIGIGASYFDVIYDSNSNVTNQAISTHITWAFRSNLRYDLWKYKNSKSQIVLGYYHNSNGHLRLPNYGLNTFILGLNTEFRYNISKIDDLNLEIPNRSKNTSSIKYYSYRFGLGQNVLTKYDDNKREVYTVSASFGKIKSKTFKYGAGFYYRFYENYYHYIQNGQLVAEMYPDLKKNPLAKASSFGMFADGEVLMNHIGIELNIGFNFYKPFYKVDYKLNEGKIIDDGSYQLGKLDWYYNVKHLISSRFGLKYYALNTNNSPKHNVFLGAFINANLGQADFTELGIGYVFCPSIKKK